MEIRRAGPDDVDALLTISTGLWREDAGTHDPEVMNTDWPRQHGRASFEALLTISSGLWAEDAGTHDPEVMNTDWPREHGRASFESLVDDPDRVGLLAEVDGELAAG